MLQLKTYHIQRLYKLGHLAIEQTITQHPLGLHPDLELSRALCSVAQHHPPESREPFVDDPLAEQGCAISALQLEQHNQQRAHLARYRQITDSAVVALLAEPTPRTRDA